MPLGGERSVVLRAMLDGRATPGRRSLRSEVCSTLAAPDGVAHRIISPADTHGCEQLRTGRTLPCAWRRCALLGGAAAVAGAVFARRRQAGPSALRTARWAVYKIGRVACAPLFPGGTPACAGVSSGLAAQRAVAGASPGRVARAACYVVFACHASTRLCVFAEGHSRYLSPTLSGGVLFSNCNGGGRDPGRCRIVRARSLLGMGLQQTHQLPLRREWARAQLSGWVAELFRMRSETLCADCDVGFLVRQTQALSATVVPSALLGSFTRGRRCVVRPLGFGRGWALPRQRSLACLLGRFATPPGTATQGGHLHRRSATPERPQPAASACGLAGL